MTYQELSEVRKTLRVDWYRCPTRPGLLRELSQRSDAQAWFQAGGHLALFVITGALVFWLLVERALAGISRRALLSRYRDQLFYRRRAP